MLCLKSYHYRKPKYLGEQPRGRITNARWNDPGRVGGGNRRRSREKESTSFFLRRPARNRKREEKAIIRLVSSKRAAFSPPRCLFSSFSFIHTRTHTHTYILNSVPCPLHLPFFLAGWFRLRPPFSRLDSAPLISPFAVSSPPSPSLLFHWPHQHTY